MKGQYHCSCCYHHSLMTLFNTKIYPTVLYTVLNLNPVFKVEYIHSSSFTHVPLPQGPRRTLTTAAPPSSACSTGCCWASCCSPSTPPSRAPPSRRRTCDTAGPGRLTINAYSLHCLIALSTLDSIILLASSLVG